MDILMILVSTYRDSLNAVEPSIYQNLYEDLLSIFQGMFFILNNAGLYVAGCVLSFLAAMFMIFGRDARKVAELKEDLREKVIVIACLGGITSFIGLIITVSYGIGS